ncbi:helix-turn-helix domain-containing protein [Deinococcus phoenicis]|uniref:helix-turn-helix domain-containing protein n=1 Tax=Deinococcus phoenicis TaxID=1476583 RepID=UPI0009DE2CE6|nr:helix-turn-helix transcriptional regulator [Deinococcus phoenicis]
MPTDTVGQRIKEARERADLSVRRLAKLALGGESNARQITCWEKGKVIPSLESLRKIAPFLNTSVAELIPDSTLNKPLKVGAA